MPVEKSFEVLDGPFPFIIKGDDSDKYVRTFCLKCEKADVCGMKCDTEAHDGCEGPVVFVHESFTRNSAKEMHEAVVRVNQAISTLQMDKLVLNKIRKEYKVPTNEEE
jgi:hypothetical protein